MSEPPFMPEWGWNGVFVFMGALVGALASGAVAWWLERKRLEWQSTDARRRIAAGLDAELELLVEGVQASLVCDDALATMTTVATFRPLMTVFSANTDQLSHLEPELARATIGAYQNMHHHIDRGHEMWQEAERVRFDMRRRGSTFAHLREDAEAYVPRLQSWLEAAKELRRRLGEVIH